jgi:PAS domain S-box-containing protein
MVIDADAAQLRLIVAWIEPDGLRVLACRSAEEALCLLRRVAAVDVIVTDLHMPHIDRWRLGHLLRSRQDTACNHVPILVLFATFARVDATRINTALGGHAFLSVPYDPTVLRARVRDLLASTGREGLHFMRLGAYGYLRKSFDPVYLVDLCARALRERTLLRVEELLEERTQALRASEAQLRLLFDRIPDPVLVRVADETILAVNEVGARWLGWPGAHAVGRPINTLLTPGPTPPLDIPQSALTNGSATTLRTMFTGHTGRCMIVEVTELSSECYGKPALLSVVRDITGRERAMRAIQTTKDYAEPEAKDDRPLRVLLAEDNAVNQRLTMCLLEKRGHTVTVAQDGTEALAALRRQTFDVVLMDIQMPHMNGLKTTQAIRAREQHTATRIPIVALIVYAMQGDWERFLAAGMDGYVTKPLRSTELFEVIARLTAPAAYKSETPCAPEEEQDILDRKTLWERVAGDADLLREIIELFLADCPERLLELHAALMHQDCTALARAAHRLKGALGNISANNALAAVRRVETLALAEDVHAATEALARLEDELTRLLPLLTVCAGDGPVSITS